jgi:iron(III) transport system substrate-binding protein
VLARLEAERGNPRADVVVLASWGEGQDLASRGFVAPYASPERARCATAGTRGGLAAQGGAALAVIVNTNEVAEDERPTSWFDLLGPEWQDAVTMPDPTLSGSAAEFLAIFVQNFGDEAWTLFADLAEQRPARARPQQRRAEPGPDRRAARHDRRRRLHHLRQHRPRRGARDRLPGGGHGGRAAPVFLQDGAPNAEGGQAFVDFMLSEAGQALVANVFLIPSREGVAAQRPVPGDFVALPADDAEVAATVGAIVERFRSEIVEGIVQQR